jgi:hypothetical protein
MSAPYPARFQQPQPPQNQRTSFMYRNRGLVIVGSIIAGCVILALIIGHALQSFTTSGSSFSCVIATNNDGSWQANVGVTGPDTELPPIVHFELGFFDSSGNQIGSTETGGYNPYVATGQTLWADDAADNNNTSLNQLPSTCQVLSVY